MKNELELNVTASEVVLDRVRYVPVNDVPLRTSCADDCGLFGKHICGLVGCATSERPDGVPIHWVVVEGPVEAKQAPDPKQADRVTVDGVEYVGVEGHGCQGCVANHNKHLCDKLPHCTFLNRADGRALNFKPAVNPDLQAAWERRLTALRTLKRTFDDLDQQRACLKNEAEAIRRSLETRRTPSWQHGTIEELLQRNHRSEDTTRLRQKLAAVRARVAELDTHYLAAQQRTIQINCSWLNEVRQIVGPGAQVVKRHNRGAPRYMDYQIDGHWFCYQA